jgi:preprotein translocase subunit YajC
MEGYLVKNAKTVVLTLAMMPALAIALAAFGIDTVAKAAEGAGDAAGAGLFGSYGTIIMLLAMIAVFYFFMIRPEGKRKKKLKEMRESLSVGDTITTIGGMLGKVVSVDGEKLTFETGEDRVRIQVAKWSVANIGKATGTEEPTK